MNGYKTLIYTAVTGLGALGVIFGMDIDPANMDKVAAGLVAIYTIGNGIFRILTKSPIFKK